MPNEIVRFNDGPTQDVTFTTSESTTGGFSLAVYSGAIVMVTSVSGATALVWKCKENASSSAVFQVADATNVPLQTSIQAGRAYSIPDELFAAGYVMPTTNQGTATCRVIVKG